MSKISFIINPVAGGGKAKGLIPLIESKMEKYEKEYSIKLTTKPEEAIKIAENSVEDYDIIVAVGGDGTINEVARGLVNKGKGILGIIPGGTGNDMAKSLGISIDPERALEHLCNGKNSTIDVGQVNDFVFFNIASIGFDAEVVMNTINIKKAIRSRFAYGISVIYSLFSFKKKKIQINIDGEFAEEDVILVAVGNGKYYGGGMEILPDAKVNDEYLDVCIISGIRKTKLLFLFPSIFKGNHIKYTKYVKIYRGKNIRITSKEGLYLNIDGEINPKVKDIEFNLKDKRLNVIT